MEQEMKEKMELMSRIHHRSLDVWDRIMAKSYSKLSGLSTEEISVLRILCQQPDKIMKEIGEELGVGKSTLTGIIDRLEKRGYLRRVINPRDRRSFGLEITRQGKAAQREHVRIEADLYGDIVTFLRENGALDAYLELSQKLLDTLEQKYGIEPTQQEKGSG